MPRQSLIITPHFKINWGEKIICFHRFNKCTLNNKHQLHRELIYSCVWIYYMFFGRTENFIAEFPQVLTCRFTVSEGVLVDLL